jgi:hypothetical protein
LLGGGATSLSSIISGWLMDGDATVANECIS